MSDMDEIYSNNFPQTIQISESRINYNSSHNDSYKERRNKRNEEIEIKSQIEENKDCFN